MSVRFERTLNHAFVLNEEKLSRIAEILADAVGEIEIRAKCSDDGVRKFESIHDLLSYENPKGKRILSMSIDASNTNDNIKEISVSLQQNAMFLTVKGMDPYASQCKDNLCDILTGTKPWYWWLADKDYDFFFQLFFGCFFVFVIYVNWDGNVPKNPETGSFSKTTVLIASIAILAWLMARARRALFPFSQFIIGQEKQNASRQEWFRKLCVGGLARISHKIS